MAVTFGGGGLFAYKEHEIGMVKKKTSSWNISDFGVRRTRSRVILDWKKRNPGMTFDRMFGVDFDELVLEL